MEKIEQYFRQFPPETQVILRQTRQLILETAPSAVEGFSYGMPAYKLNGKPLIYFAGYKNHIGIYATPSGHKAIEKELADYKQGKGSVQFPLNKPFPFDLIKKMLEYKKLELGK